MDYDPTYYGAHSKFTLSAKKFVGDHSKIQSTFLKCLLPNVPTRVEDIKAQCKIFMIDSV